jgi:predicted SAM-dependent methyltransferase
VAVQRSSGQASSSTGPEPSLVEIVAYAEQLDTSRARELKPRRTDPPLRRLGKHVVPQRLRRPVRLAATRLRGGREEQRAAALAAARGALRLHLGSGPVRKQGWTNVDLVGDSVDLAWDLTQPLPFPDGSVAAIFHEHFLVVFPLSAGLAQLRDSYRVLEPGGILRIGVPDPWKDRSDLPAVAGKSFPRLLVMQEVFYYPDNKTMYDGETLALLLRAVGFSSVEERRFGESRLEPCPDSEHRREWTVYVEAVK